jgi:hypothetical protein
MRALILLSLLLFSCKEPIKVYRPLCRVVWHSECKFGVCKVEFETGQKTVVQGGTVEGDVFCWDHENDKWKLHRRWAPLE